MPLLDTPFDLFTDRFFEVDSTGLSDVSMIGCVVCVGISDGISGVLRTTSGGSFWFLGQVKSVCVEIEDTDRRCRFVLSLLIMLLHFQPFF